VFAAFSSFQHKGPLSMSDEVKTPIAKRGQKHTEQPLTTASLRQELLEAAGFDREYQIELMRQVVEGAQDALKATKETPGFNLGSLGDVHRQPDHSARAKARDQLVDLIGASGKASGIQHDKGPKAEIPLPPWMLNMTFTSPAQPSVVVEAVESLPIVDAQVDESAEISSPSPIVDKDDISHL
jgi:hypothetical protein